MAEASVGPYRILERLGAGANGEVFLAEDTRLHRRVALKTLHGTGGSDRSELRRRLLREARAAARLNHPHIAAVYDVLESDEAIHIVMEYVPGTTLAARVRQGPLPHMQVLDYALQISGALVHAHELGVVHRDLKPANVVASPAGQAKILDFGLARLHEVDVGSAHLSASDLSTAEAHQAVGTPPYMPPELLRGERFDVRGDIYSLGVSLFELLTGRRPFEARDGMALTAAILTAPTPRPRSVTPEVPAELDEVVYRAIARDSKDRYQSAADLQSDLKRLAAGISDAPTVARRLPLLLARGQRRIGWTALACVAVTAGLYGAVGPGQRLWRASEGTAGSPAAAAPRVVAVLPLVGAAGDPEMESLAAGVADSLITSLSKVPGLVVISRAATLKYRERKNEPHAIARELGATMLVDGGVQRSGEHLRITLSVQEPSSKLVRWQDSYDGTFAQVFTLQREVAAAVAHELELGPTPVNATDRPATLVIEAFAEYAQARSFLERPDVSDNVDRAITLFESASKRDPRFARAHAGLGEAFWRKYQATRDERWSVAARDSIHEALRLDPTDASVRLSMAAVYRGMGRLDQAIEELRNVIHTQPHADEAHRHLGQALIDTGKRAEGMAEIQEAIRLRPHYWAHHHTLGVAHYTVGSYRDAIRCFRRVTELQPDSAWGYHMLGTTYHAMDDTASAIPNYERAIQLGNAKAYANLGLIYLVDRRYENAARSFREALKREPASAMTHHNLGEAYSQMGQRSQAEAQFREALRLSKQQVRVNPRDAATITTLAVVEAKLGMLPDARRHIRLARELAPDSAESSHGEATVSVLAGEPEQALTALERALTQGYSAKRAASDPWLRPLRRHPRFAAMLVTRERRGGSD
jgi:tetratricopeptide (TPR) repeat protein